MGIFGKKKECCCQDKEANLSAIDNMAQTKESQLLEPTIKILGGGCAKCNQLEENTRDAIKSMGIDIKVVHINDYTEIASYGVMSTPALVYDKKVLCYGKVPKTEEIVSLLQKEV
ncbi:MAG: thioredoxin family protein [Anaerovoracaceae bacterium]